MSQSTRRAFLAAAGAVSLARRAQGASSHVRAGCLVNAGDFDSLITALKTIQGLGYLGVSTDLKVLRSQAGRVEEVHPQLEGLGLDLISVRATLPRFEEDHDRAIEDIGRLSMAARQFGAVALFLHGPGLAEDGKFAESAIVAKAKFLDEAGQRCTENGVYLAYRTQDAEFQNDAAEVTGLMSRTNIHRVYFALDLERASKIYKDAIGFFQEHPNRTYAIEVPLADFPARELAAAVHHGKWISWMIETAPAEAARAVMKKAFGM